MKAEKLMTNDADDPFRVLVYARVNVVNQWSCRNFVNARRSVALFFAQEPCYRSRAVIREKSGQVIEAIHKD